MSTGAPILITVPKYVNLGSPSPVFKDYVECKPQNEGSRQGRKRRLDHLTWEEKILRKKLKNREAAQTSRDKKKMRMDQMEATIQDLRDSNEKLKLECKSLRVANKKLSSENSSLTLQLTAATPPCTKCASQSSLVETTLTIGSAVSNTNPLPQGPRVASATVLTRPPTTSTLLRMLMMMTCLMSCSPTSARTSTSTTWARSLTACSKISPQTWRAFLNKDRFLRIIAKKMKQEQWWGRHQSNWNPVELKRNRKTREN